MKSNSTTPASPPTSGCSPTTSHRSARARCSSSTPASGSSHCARTWARRTASGIAQFQLVHIHPFVDGNGRTSRLLSTLYLYRAGYDFKRLFTISEFYDRDRTSFYTALQGVREADMDLTGWLEYFVTGLDTQLAEVTERGKLAIQVDVLIREHGLNARQGIALRHLLLPRFVVNPDFRSARPRCQSSNAAARSERDARQRHFGCRRRHPSVGLSAGRNKLSLRHVCDILCDMSTMCGD